MAQQPILNQPSTAQTNDTRGAGNPGPRTQVIQYVLPDSAGIASSGGHRQQGDFMNFRILVMTLMVAIGALGFVAKGHAARVIDLEIGVAPPPPRAEVVIPEPREGYIVERGHYIWWERETFPIFVIRCRCVRVETEPEIAAELPKPFLTGLLISVRWESRIKVDRC